MIVVDDYIDGRIYAGQDKYDLAHLPARMVEAIGNLKDTHTKNNPIQINDGRNDFYVFHMEEEDLLKYMADRNCLNCITGV